MISLTKWPSPWSSKVQKLTHPTLSVQFSCSVVSDSATPWTAAHPRPPCPSPTPGVHPNPCPLSWWCHPTISSSVVPFFSSIFPNIKVFSNESALHIRWPKYWSFSFKISPTNEHPGLISFRMDWLDLLAVPPFTPKHTWKRPPHWNGCSNSMLCNHAVSTFTQEFNHCLQILVASPCLA